MIGVIIQVMLADGTRVHSSVVLSNATPHRTFMVIIFCCVFQGAYSVLMSKVLGLCELLNLISQN